MIEHEALRKIGGKQVELLPNRSISRLGRKKQKKLIMLIRTLASCAVFEL